MSRDLNRVAGILQRVDALEKNDRIFGKFHPDFLGMFAVIQTDANDRTRLNRREQFCDNDFFSGDAWRIKNISGKFQSRAVSLLRGIIDSALLILVANDFHDAMLMTLPDLRSGIQLIMLRHNSPFQLVLGSRSVIQITWTTNFDWAFSVPAKVQTLPPSPMRAPQEKFRRKSQSS